MSSAAAAFDAKLIAEMKASGGEKYVPIAVLAYRQSLAAHKLAADYDGTPLFFAKENFSNGCIATVDVIYPAAPMYLLLNTALVRGHAHARPRIRREPAAGSSPSPRTTSAPTRRPTARSTAAASETEENQMPVEESGNMLILAAALSPSSTATPTTP